MKVSVDGQQVHYQIEGQGPWLVFCNSLGTDLRMWDAQAAHFSATYTVLRYDVRGHGQSDASWPPFSLDDLSNDLLGLLDNLEIGQADLVGISLGGLIAQTLALDHPSRVRDLVLVDTTSRYPEAGKAMWRTRAQTVLTQGMQPIVGPSLQFWFTPNFEVAQPAALAKARDMLLQCEPTGYAGCCGALEAADTHDRLSQIHCRTLVVVGDGDLGTPLPMSEALQAGIKGSELCVIKDAAHLSTFEQPEAFNSLLRGFLD